jgi:hypothetical protein
MNTLRDFFLSDSCNFGCIIQYSAEFFGHFFHLLRTFVLFCLDIFQQSVYNEQFVKVISAFEGWMVQSCIFMRFTHHVEKIVLQMSRHYVYKHDYQALLMKVSNMVIPKAFEKYVQLQSELPSVRNQFILTLCKRGYIPGGISPFLFYILAKHVYKVVNLLFMKFLCLSPQLISKPTAKINKPFGNLSSISSSGFTPPFHSLLSSQPRSFGGHRIYTFTYKSLEQYILPRDINQLDITQNVFRYADHVNTVNLLKYPHSQFIHAHIPLSEIIPHLAVPTLRKIAKIHNCSIGSHAKKRELEDAILTHSCPQCNTFVTVFTIELSNSEKNHMRVKRSRAKKQLDAKSNEDGKFTCFPPEPLTESLGYKLVLDACNKMEGIEEAGCAVCGELKPATQLSPLKHIKNLLHILKTEGVTRVARNSSQMKEKEYTGPVLDYRCKMVCDKCREAIRKGKIPRLALAQGLWLGDVPPELSNLRFVEKLLIARVRHTCCYVKIATGGRKMKANVVAFETPLPKVYSHLPPPRSDMDDVLAIFFTGPCRPTEDDFKRSLMLVRRNVVVQALEWLKLNHRDYTDIGISHENLAEYSENEPPCSVEYKALDTNKTAEGTSVHDMEAEDGVEDGDCAFTVHGLTGEKLDTMTTAKVKAIALQHLNSQGKFLVVGHHDKPESIWDNPHLYPKMFPWLFPYGLGGIGTTELSDKEHKRHLLMYHDKRFQTDPTFPFVAFSHEQVKATTTQSFLLAEKSKFENIANRLLTLDQAVLNQLIEKMAQGENAAPESDEEKTCFQIINDLDHIAGNIKGSTTSKKYMRNEIWSLVTHCGAPSWYITLSPADTKHPICLYYAGTNTKFKPLFQNESERIRQICKNPVASARFFHFLVEVFIDVVLGIKSNHRGLYGETEAYYGTVEQQGRLALHLHLLLWIKGSLRPQEIRERIMRSDSDFQKSIVKWIESCVAGEFFTGTQEEVITKVAEKAQASEYVNPTETLPIPPPPQCHQHQTCSLTCKVCTKINEWWSSFKETVDDILTKSNIHSCTRNKNKDGGNNKKHVYVGCMDNKWGKCKARFPRLIFQETTVDKETGSIDMKKKEPWLNTFTPIITYLFRCNTDVTCLFSGTAIKAVILYVSDYITKAPLKTHVIFEAIKSIFTKNTELICGTLPSREKARRLMSKIVNLLSTKLEMGAPMISMYLLQNPDHYTSHKFIPFYWKSFVTEARKHWHHSEESFEPDKIALMKKKGKIIGLSPVFDYIYRSSDLEEMNLYEWIRRCERKKISKKQSGTAKKNSTLLFEQQSEPEDDNRLSPPVKKLNQSKQSKSKYATYHFLQTHPLHDTHYIQVADLNDKIAANFIGGPLPRMDQGDREYYCSTMLTFFKPWRSGQDLKLSVENWNTAFLNYKFTKKQEELMKNMNIRYECLDSRDDYRAQLKKNSGILPVWAEAQLDIEIDGIHGDICHNSDGVDDEGVPLHLLSIGKGEIRRQRETLTMRNIMNNIGWTKEIYHKDLYNKDELDPSSITRFLNGAEWKAEVSKKRQEVLDAQRHYIPAEKTVGSMSTTLNSSANVVKIADKSYLIKKLHKPEHQKDVNNVVHGFSLNDEQERAFRIVANHASDSYQEPLRMFLAGMAGTGKSQVLKSLIRYFQIRNESYRLMIVAPTGNAAALLGGSTYHSSLGINDYNEKSALNLSQVRARLIGVDYIFLDEVSMLSCHDMYRISCQLALALNMADQPFGGISMLFAGDFAQLPPVIGGENSALYSRKVGAIASHHRSQEEAMGKALWHQVTTVVILRKNMRQREQTEEDKKLRTALENMRYKACTPADIAFLQTKISSPVSGESSVCDERFRDVPIITGLNVHKDEVNRLGSVRFAVETNQQLTHFYSDDFPKQPARNKKASNNKVQQISEELQKILWDQPPSTCDKHIPGKLSLCRGMPVMIRSNAATELCITKGQEGIVYGWQSTKGSHGQLILDTLFVKLVNPPSNVKFEGLPENVVPLYKTTTVVCCTLPDDIKLYIQRNQVEILPNFGLTDFASQGKTRPNNPVDLNNCRSHQSYYTVLSRSATAAGTLILQGFHPQKITGGASGALRQEFRELELLDEITTLRYESRLNKNVIGDQRNMLIAAFRKWKGLHYVPHSVHQAIRWSSKDPLLEPEIEDIKWKIIDKQKNKKKFSETHSGLTEEKKVQASAVSDIQLTLKRKRSQETELKTPKKKKNSTIPAVDKVVQIANPVGLSWSNNSCAYDSVFSIIYSLWKDDPDYWKSILCHINREFFPAICSGFLDLEQGLTTLESVRDELRHLFHDLHLPRLRWGIYTSANQVMRTLFTTSRDLVSSQLACKNQHQICRLNPSSLSCYVLDAGTTQYQSISGWMQNFVEVSRVQCDICGEFLLRQFHFESIPQVLIFDVEGVEMVIDKEIQIVKNGKYISMALKGVIYFGEYHYTSRVIVNNQVWFHDGLSTGKEMMYEGELHTMTDFYHSRGKEAHVAVYA